MRVISGQESEICTASDETRTSVCQPTRKPEIGKDFWLELSDLKVQGHVSPCERAARCGHCHFRTNHSVPVAPNQLRRHWRSSRGIRERTRSPVWLRTFGCVLQTYVGITR